MQTLCVIMKMTFRTINIILFILCFNPIFGQTNVLIPNKGIEEISIVIDSSTISDVIEIYGTDLVKERVCEALTLLETIKIQRYQ